MRPVRFQSHWLATWIACYFVGLVLVGAAVLYWHVEGAWPFWAWSLVSIVIGVAVEERERAREWRRGGRI